MLNLSVCYITKNEEKCLEQSLKSLSSLINAGANIVVTDTGSSDSTCDIAARYTSNIHHYDWTGDFSAARNYCASMATTDWILFLDADEHITDINIDSITEYIATNTNKAGRITMINPTKSGTTTIDTLARLYNKKNYNYSGIIHEQLAPVDTDIIPTPIYQNVPITVFHSGYQDENLIYHKAKRNLELLEIAYNKTPDDPYIIFQLAQTNRLMGNKEKALEYYNIAISMDLDEKAEYVHTLIESYGYTLLDLEKYDDALALYNVYDIFATRADFFFLMGLANMKSGNIPRAIEEFEKAINTKNYSVEGTNSYNAYYNLGVIYECIGDIKKATDCYKQCGSFPLALSRLEQIS